MDMPCPKSENWTCLVILNEQFVESSKLMKLKVVSLFVYLVVINPFFGRTTEYGWMKLRMFDL